MESDSFSSSEKLFGKKSCVTVGPLAPMPRKQFVE